MEKGKLAIAAEIVLVCCRTALIPEDKNELLTSDNMHNSSSIQAPHPFLPLAQTDRTSLV